MQTAIAAGVTRVALFHHDPYHPDAEVDEILKEARKLHPDVLAAREGLEITL
jgi:phosphoribosyl 1,2-cyclic phosphodiesterase